MQGVDCEIDGTRYLVFSLQLILGKLCNNMRGDRGELYNSLINSYLLRGNITQAYVVCSMYLYRESSNSKSR